MLNNANVAAVGCPDLLAPHGGWTKRLENVAVFGCNGTSRTWRLKCDDLTWRGGRFNCTNGKIGDFENINFKDLHGYNEP